MNIGSNIRCIRLLKNLSQEYVAGQLEVSQSTYSRIESSGNEIKFSDLVKVAEIFEISLIELIEFRSPI